MRALTRTLTLANDAREQDHTHHVESLKMCCGVLAILSRDEANKLLIARDGMRLLCAIMEQHLGRADLLEAACDLLWSLAFNNPLMKEVIGRQGGIPAILKGVKMHPASADFLKSACGALSNMCQNAHNQSLIAAHGGVPCLLQVLHNHRAHTVLVPFVFDALASLIVGNQENARQLSEVGAAATILSLMDELMIPEAQRHAMLVMDDAKKWKMVEESRLGQAATRADGRSFADGLRVGGDRAVERVVELARVLRTCDRRFLDEFIRHDGVKQLFSLQMNWDPVRKARHCHDFVECCRGVMNTGQAGLDAVMATPFAVRCLASYLAPQQAHISGSTALLGTQHRAHVLELLAAVCVMEDTAGYSLVLDALDNIRLAHAQPSRFTCVLAALGEAGPTETASAGR